MNGEIEVTSEKGKGSVFTVVFKDVKKVKLLLRKIERRNSILKSKSFDYG